VVSAVEHSSVLHAVADFDVTEVGVDREGLADAEAFGAALRGDTALACLQSANHEVGTLQPVARAAELCREAGVPLLVDAAQSLGWSAVDGPWSLLAASAHKWGGPPGVGLLAVRKGTRFVPQGPVDENLPAIVAAAASLRAVRAEAQAEAARLSRLVDRVRTRVPQLVPDVEVVGHPTLRLPHIVTFSCLYVDGEALLHELDRAGFAVSSGSSCTSSTLVPSHVLRAMGVLSEGNVRVSLPRGVAQEDVERFLEALPGIVAGVRGHLAADVRPTATSSSAEGPALLVDSLGKRCPIPVIELAKVIGDVPVGAIVSVLSDDEAARLDIPAWCGMRGQEYVGERTAPRGAAYWVRRLA
jgi:cysteine desulfurase